MIVNNAKGQELRMRSPPGKSISNNLREEPSSPLIDKSTVERIASEKRPASADELMLVLEEEPEEAPLQIKDAAPVPAPNQSQKPVRIDTSALNGLRGVASLHIMLYHYGFPPLGRLELPLFFLISGYIFGICEGNKNYALTPCCTECTELRTPISTNELETPSDKISFDSKNFYARRAARTLPLYYLCNLIMIPLIYYGGLALPRSENEHRQDFADFIGNLLGIEVDYVWWLLTATATTTWFAVPFNVNEPSWFVSTIWFFYWLFPSLLPRLQTHGVAAKRKLIVACYWVQFLGGIGLLILCATFGDELDAINALWWPPLRLPLFVMGVCAGLLRIEGLPLQTAKEMWRARDWSEHCDVLSAVLFAFFVGFGALNGLGYIEIADNDRWMELGIAWWWLQLIQALTFDEGASRIYKVLTSRVVLAVGRISYALYLVHQPVKHYFQWAQIECRGKDCRTFTPWWRLPLLSVVSIIAAVFLNRCVEEPMRKCLRNVLARSK